jgi:RNA polymerase sigma-70 factor (ECF subfamily)
MMSGHGRAFPATRWSLIFSAREAPEQRRVALEELLTAYWRPLYCFARLKGLDAEAAKDAVQSFVVHLLEHDVLARVDPEKGRFRSFLRTALANHLVNMRQHDGALKRGGGVQLVPLDVDLAERLLGDQPLSAEDAFDRAWALRVMERALAALRREFESGARRGPVEVALRFFQPGTPPTYAEAAAAAGMSETQLKAFLHRARVRFRRLVRDEVAETLPDAKDVDAEMAHLVRALGA